MRPKLKESPREWLKFTAVIAFAMAVIAALLWRRHVIGQTAFGVTLGLAGLTALTCCLRPRWFRGFYRVGMTASFHVGQIMGRILLGLVFLVLITPLGLVLRTTGKDLLGLTRRLDATSYWVKAKSRGRLDQQF
jgi:hypothetical protein